MAQRTDYQASIDTALREIEEAAQDFWESSAPQGWSPSDGLAYYDARKALRAAIERAHRAV